jgi:hypothetical protein
LIDGCDDPKVGDRFTEMDGSFEAKIDRRREPSNLPADFGSQAGDRQSMANWF